MARRLLALSPAVPAAKKERRQLQVLFLQPEPSAFFLPSAGSFPICWPFHWFGTLRILRPLNLKSL